MVFLFKNITNPYTIKKMMKIKKKTKNKNSDLSKLS